MLKKFKIKEWRQFSEIDISFHPHLTILTGSNGSGKTTILNLLSNVIGWNPNFVSSYEKDKLGISRYFNGLEITEKNLKQINAKNNHLLQEHKLGQLEFENGEKTDIVLPTEIASGTYNVIIYNNSLEKGVYIDSHRPTFPYRSLNKVPTSVSTRQEIYQKYDEFNRAFIFDTYRNQNEMSATLLIKETLAALAIFGYGNNSVTPNKIAKTLFEGYVDILKIMLPEKLGFEGIIVDIPEVMMCTKSGKFPIDAVSGGISSIINITWQLYMFGEPTESFIALIDEPENHLHPELQKNFLTNLISAFPNVQFIVATHNPLMITSQKDSFIYILDYDNDNKVYSHELDYVNRAGTSNQILRDVLGIDSTTPNWAVKELNKIVEKYSNIKLSNDSLSNLRSELDSIGLGDYIPESIVKLMEEEKTNDKINKN